MVDRREEMTHPPDDAFANFNLDDVLDFDWDLNLQGLDTKKNRKLQMIRQHHQQVVDEFEEKSNHLNQSLISVVERVKKFETNNSDIFKIVQEYTLLRRITKKSQLYLDKFEQLHYSNLKPGQKKSIRNTINAKTSVYKNIVSCQVYEHLVVLMAEEIRALAGGSPGPGDGGGGGGGSGGNGGSGSGGSSANGSADGGSGSGGSSGGGSGNGGSGSGNGSGGGGGGSFGGYPGGSGAPTGRVTANALLHDITHPSQDISQRSSAAYMEALMNWRTESSTWVSDEEDSSSPTSSEVDVPTDTNSTETEPEAEIREYPLDDDTQMHSSPSPKREASIEIYEPQDVVPISNDESKPHQEAANITKTTSFSTNGGGSGGSGSGNGGGSGGGGSFGGDAGGSGAPTGRGKANAPHDMTYPSQGISQRSSAAYLEALTKWRTDSLTWVPDEEDLSASTASGIDASLTTNTAEVPPSSAVAAAPSSPSIESFIENPDSLEQLKLCESHPRTPSSIIPQFTLPKRKRFGFLKSSRVGTMHPPLPPATRDHHWK